MSCKRLSFFHLAAVVLCAQVAAQLATPVRGEENPALAGYSNYERLGAAIAEIDQSEWATVVSLGKTQEGRDLPLIKIAAGDDATTRPVVVVVGAVSPAHVAAGELALRLARQLATRAASEEAVRAMLARCEIHILPVASPDAYEKCFRGPFVEPIGNARSTDDDSDGESGEDPPEDLNGDGWITMMRVADPSGTHMPHPDDTRVLIEADRAKNERGQFRLYMEGRDNDGDEQFNEDRSGGVSFDRNFPFQYPFFGRSAGPHQVSEPETRAIADYLYNLPQAAIVLSYGAEDNLLRPWKANPQEERGRIKTTLLSADAPYQDRLSELYRKLRPGDDSPESPGGEGSFAEWAYFHLGRWSLTTRVWWIPKTDPAPAADGQAPKPSDEKRGAEEINALRWFAAKGIEGFVEWRPIEHADFPGKTVEVGGFKPFYRNNPPAGELDGLAEKQVAFLLQVSELLPRLEIREQKAESLGGGVFRVSAQVANAGYLPTMPEMGVVNGEPFPLQVMLSLPEGGSLLRGRTRTRLARLTGNGDSRAQEWLVRFAAAPSASAPIKIWAPAAGSSTAEVTFTP